MEPDSRVYVNLIDIQVLSVKENHVPDYLCLCGRIHKDRFVDSEHSDQDALQNAIHWWVTPSVQVASAINFGASSHIFNDIYIRRSVILHIFGASSQ